MLAVFENELQKGTGVAILMIKEGLVKPSKETDEVVLDNIFNNRSYDPQCEGSKHDYLYELVQAYSRKEEIISEVLKRFEEMADTDYGEWQVFAFVEKLVSGGLVDKRLLYDKFLFYSKKELTPYSIGVREIISADGLVGIKFLAKIIGTAITEENRADFQGFPFFDETECANIGLTVEQAIEVLRNEHDRDIDRYLEFVRLEQSSPIPPSERESAASIMVKLRTSRSYVLRRWMREASESEVGEISELFLLEKDRGMRKKILVGLGDRCLQVSLADLTQDFFRSRDESYREALFDVMLRLDDRSILEIIEKRFSEKTKIFWIKAVLRFFSLDLEERLIGNLSELNSHEFHHMTKDILSSESLGGTEALSRVLRLLYLNNRCSLCRERVVSRMIEENCLEANLATELRYDVNLNTRKMVEKFQAKIS